MDDSGPCAAVAAAALLLLFGAAAGTEPLATEENSSSYSSSYSGRSGLPADGIGLFGRLQLLADDLAGDLAPLHLHPHTRPISLASLKMQLQGSIHGRDAATMSIQDSSNSIHLGIDKSNLRWSRRWRWRWRAGLKSRTTPRCCRPAASATFPDRWSGLSTGAGTSSPPTYPAPPKAPAKPNQSIRFVDPSVSNTILRKASVLRIRMDDGQDGQGGQDGLTGESWLTMSAGSMTRGMPSFSAVSKASLQLARVSCEFNASKWLKVNKHESESAWQYSPASNPTAIDQQPHRKPSNQTESSLIINIINIINAEDWLLLVSGNGSIGTDRSLH